MTVTDLGQMVASLQRLGRPRHRTRATLADITATGLNALEHLEDHGGK